MKLAIGSKVLVFCTECGSGLNRFPSKVVGRKFGVFCSKLCLGAFRSKKLTGDMAANFKAGSKRDRNYIRVHAQWHPFRDNRGYVSLHRLILESRLGKFLPEELVVHHLDGNSMNNHWDNLQAISQAEHARGHMSGRDKKTGRLTRSKQ